VKYIIGFLCVFASAQPAAAQRPWPVSAEAYFGHTIGKSGKDLEYRGGGKSGPLLELLLGARLHAADRSGVYVAVHGSTNLINWVTTDDCVLSPDGGCVPWFPGVTGVAGMIGWESRSTVWRALAGFGNYSYSSADGHGYSIRLDVAAPQPIHLSPTAALSVLYLPDFEGDRITYLSASVGLRVR
jgi:hypothetical protein